MKYATILYGMIDCVVFYFSNLWWDHMPGSDSSWVLMRHLVGKITVFMTHSIHIGGVMLVMLVNIL